MSSVRIRFSMVVIGAATDNKTKVWALHSMQLLNDDDDESHAIPTKFSDLSHHDKLFTFPPAKTALKKMPKRHASRSFCISLPPDVTLIYVDTNGNPVFHGDPLDIFNDGVHEEESVKSSSSGTILAAVCDAVLAAITPMPR